MKKLLSILTIILCLSVQGQEIESWSLEKLKSQIANAEKPTIFNFWATFCKPCIEEIPYFEKTAKEQGVELILVSLDAKALYPKKLQEFIKKRGFKAKVVYLSESNADLFCPAVDPAWSGAIPASLFVNKKTGHRKFFEEQLSEKELLNEVTSLKNL